MPKRYQKAMQVEREEREGEWTKKEERKRRGKLGQRKAKKVFVKKREEKFIKSKRGQRRS